MSITRERVLKLEEEMAVVGESEPHFLAFARCVEESEGTVSSAPRGGSHCCFEKFIDRLKKSIVACQTEVSQAQEVLAKVQSKLQFEEQGFVDGEARLAALIQESAEAGMPPMSLGLEGGGGRKGPTLANPVLAILI